MIIQNSIVWKEAQIHINVNASHEGILDNNVTHHKKL